MDIVSILLKGGANVNEKGRYGQTALMRAALIGHTDLLKLLLKVGADINVKNDDDKTALMLAARNKSGTAQIVKHLIKHGANINEKDKYGHTAMMYAVGTGDVEKVKILLNHGADLKTRENDGDTALSWAASFGSVEPLKLLLKRGADVNVKNKKGHTALMWACLSRSIRIEKLKFSSPCKEYDEESKYNYRTNAYDVKLRRSYYYDENECKRQLESIKMKYLKTVKILVENGADMNAKNSSGTSVLDLCGRAESHEIEDVLKKAGAK